jgi:hypothetical protein
MTSTPINDVANDLPLPELPPPQQSNNHIPSFVHDYLNDIKSSHISSNDSINATMKSPIVNLILDNELQRHELQQQNHFNHVPFVSSTTHQTIMDIDMTEATQEPAFDNETTPTISKMWKPSLNDVIEETIQDLHFSSSNATIPSQDHISNKCFCGRIHKYNKELASYHSKITTAISNGGIYRVRIQSAQNDGKANRSVTSQKDLLLHYQDIPDFAISGVKDGEPAIYCTGQGRIPWQANSSEILLI